MLIWLTLNETFRMSEVKEKHNNNFKKCFCMTGNPQISQFQISTDDLSKVKTTSIQCEPVKLCTTTDIFVIRRHRSTL